MKIEGNILKMRSEDSDPIKYTLPVGEAEIEMNDLIGNQITLEYLHQINCIKCGRKTNKSFSQGFCYPCFSSAPETEECVMRPELCRAHEGIARDMDFAQNNCLIEQYVYLSLTSGLKVGVTRSTQVPTRWIDQGATSAVIIAQTPNRYTAGLVEVALKNHMADKTNWRNMLKGVELNIDLEAEREKAIHLLPSELQHFGSFAYKVHTLNFPLTQKLDKIGSINLDKTDTYSGTLVGIKGQYLLFADGQVINMRKYGGYKIAVSY